IRFICVQAKANSLEGFTMSDGVLSETKPSWL
ncbi:MAG: cupin domain-containing protein, partial [Bacilli bacterium]|nr:cupin domain-containing protein [Bacilli bacterium]